MLLKSTQQFLKELHRIGAVKVDTEHGFKLALHDKNPTAPLSPIYVSLRTPKNPKPGPLLPEHVMTIATEMERVVEKAHWKFDCVAGIPRAGVPFAESFAQVRAQLKRTIKVVRLRKNSRGSRSISVENDYVVREQTEQRSRVLLVDDLITKADTKWRAIDALRRGGYEVAGVVVYLDREQGGFKALSESGIPIVAVLKFGEMLDFYHSSELISDKEMSAIKRYLRW